MKEILRFKYKNTELCLFENDGNLLYVKVVDSEFIFELSTEEKEIINKVLAKLTPSRNIYDFGYIKYNQKRFRHFYDVDRNFHLFYEGDNLKIPDDKDSLFLNRLFNNQQEYFAYRKSDKNNFYNPIKNIKRIINLGGILLIVCLTVEGISFLESKFDLQPITPTIIEEKKDNDINNNYNTLKVVNYNVNYEEESKKEPVTMDMLIKALDNNSNLSNEEKDIIKDIFKYCKDSISYIDSKVLFDIEHVKIEYLQETNELDTKGKTSKPLSLISIYGVNSFEDSPKEVIKEEALHLLNKQEIPLIGNTFYEFLARLNIYERDFSNGIKDRKFSYSYLDNYYRILARFLDDDTINQYLVNSDPNLIIESLTNIIPDGSLALNLLMNLDACYNLLTSFNQGEIKEEAAETFKYLKKSIETTLFAYYNQIYQSKEENDLNILMLLDRNMAIEVLGLELNLDSETIQTIKMIPDSLIVCSHKGIFDKNIYMVLSVPIYLRCETNIYTKDELLIGKDGLKYNSIDEIMNDKDLHQIDYDHYQYTVLKESYILYTVNDIIKNEKTRG